MVGRVLGGLFWLPGYGQDGSPEPRVELCHVHARTLVGAQKLVETWASKFWKEWKLGRVGVVF